MEHLSDHDLIEAYRRGRDEALAILIRRWLAPVYRFLYRMVSDQPTAEDLTQETFLKAWRYLSRFDTKKSFKTWCFSIARNTALDYFRKKHPLTFSQLETDEQPDFTETISDMRPLPSELFDQRMTAANLEVELAKLSPGARAMVLMHETESMTFQEISDMTGEPMNTVKSRYRRALAKLREALTPGTKTPPPSV